MRMLAVAALAGTVSTLAFAQGGAPGATSTPDPRLTFEVASVRERTQILSRLVNPQGLGAGGRFSMLNSSLVRLVMYAYDLPDYQVWSFARPLTAS